MAMAEHMAMTTERRIEEPNPMSSRRTDDMLILQNWFSPAFPIGAFSYSGGLETAIARGDVHDRDSLADWLRTTLTHGTLFTDAVFLGAAQNGGDVNELCLALCSGGERYQETTELGAAFTRVIHETLGFDLPGRLAYPVAVGMAARQRGLACDVTLATFLQGACMNQISVAVRIVPIGQMDGQACLVALLPVIEQATARALATDVEEVGSFALAADLCALEHETTEQRIFRT